MLKIICHNCGTVVEVPIQCDALTVNGPFTVSGVCGNCSAEDEETKPT